MIVMNYNVIDTSQVEINENLKLQVLTVGEEAKHTIIVIDDFLKNPESLLSIIEMHPIEFVPGKWGHPTHLKLPLIRKMFDHFAREYYGITHVDDLEEKMKIGRAHV